MPMLDLESGFTVGEVAGFISGTIGLSLPSYPILLKVTPSALTQI